MALKNSLVKNEATNKEQASVFVVNGEEVKLTMNTVKNYLVSGNKENVTTQEIVMFINLCKYSKLNPFLKEAYCIKYGNEPATMVIGKEAFMKRAEANPFYDGSEAGIIILDPECGEIIYRKGTMKLPGEEIIGGYAEVWRKDRTYSTRIEVSFDEYAGRKKDGTLNGQWSKRPATMIRKVALVQALREAFPNSLGGLYAAEEQGFEEIETTVAKETPVIDVPIQEVEPQPEEPVQQESTPDVAGALFGR